MAPLQTGRNNSAKLLGPHYPCPRPWPFGCCSLPRCQTHARSFRSTQCPAVDDLGTSQKGHERHHTLVASDFPPTETRHSCSLPLIKGLQLLWQKRTAALQTPIWIDLAHTGTGSGPLASRHVGPFHSSFLTASGP